MLLLFRLQFGNREISKDWRDSCTEITWSARPSTWEPQTFPTWPQSLALFLPFCVSVSSTFHDDDELGGEIPQSLALFLSFCVSVSSTFHDDDGSGGVSPLPKKALSMRLHRVRPKRPEQRVTFWCGQSRSIWTASAGEEPS
jgi:hypothetical protein